MNLEKFHQHQTVKWAMSWPTRYAPTLKLLLLLTILATIGFDSAGAQEEDPLLQPGEAYATRFSGIDFQDGKIVILKEGVVGSIVDVRNPGTAPMGQHWIDEPQRKFLTAEEVGQVFGIALDEQAPPNIFLTATSAFGLHRNADNSDWMTGMWGPGGGPGTIYKLDTETGYAPEVFAEVKLGERANTGASLGNISFDKTYNQLFVSDLETGMIHRFDAENGAEKGTYDHGVQGRTAFTDVETSSSQSLPEIAFDPSTSAKYEDCEAGEFSKTPECWNYADFRRRVWGLGVRTVADTGEVRLFYTVWGNQAFGNPDWAGAEDEQRNSMWSIGLGEDGAFDTSTVRREFFLPDFQVDAERVAEVGYSHAVTDIAFPQCTQQNIMLISERGAVRNPGMQFEAPFSEPHESRMMRYELDESGNWLPVGRYDIGNYKRADEGEPAMKANSSGGVTFGYGYTSEWKIDLSKPNGFAWSSGHALCSAKTDGACFNPATGNKDDTAEVHGIQGMPAEAFSEMVPGANSEETDSTNQSYMIDLDINVDESGAPIEQEMARNDATTSGDVEIYAVCSAPTQTFIPPPPIHSSIATHRRWGSPQHTSRSTHRRWGSPQHSSRSTHRRRGSDIHRDRASHRRWGSPQHTSRSTHRRWGSPQHTSRSTHRRWGSPQHTSRSTHRRWGSPQHSSRATHRRRGSDIHRDRASHRRWGSPQHRSRPSHRRVGSPQHKSRPSHRRAGSPTHRQRASHRRAGSRDKHRQRASHRRAGSGNQGVRRQR